jgi:hypothetical protein
MEMAENCKVAPTGLLKMEDIYFYKQIASTRLLKSRRDDLFVEKRKGSY